MIAKYPGPCSECGAIIEKGTDCAYNADKKKIKHWTCQETEAPAEDSAKLADRLGFRHFSWDDLQGTASDLDVLLLPDGAGGDSTRRTESDSLGWDAVPDVRAGDPGCED